MDGVSIIIIGGLGLVVVLLVSLLVGQRRPDSDAPRKIELALEKLKSELLEKQLEGLVSLRDSLDSTGRLMNERLAEGTGAIDKRMELLVDIEHRLGQLQTQAENIEAVGKNIQSLSDLLKPPKLRGSLGEMLLENLLAQILPRSMFDTQHRFASGKRVDAVVKLADRLLPIDSKFPLEPFERLRAEPDSSEARKEFVRSLKKHVDDISGRYILPAEQTTDVALMYIPSEAVYYRFVSDDLETGFEYALSRNVIPSSPGHLYAFLASLASVYAHAGLSGDGRKLSAGLNNLGDALGRLTKLHERMEGSVRALTSTLSHGRDEINGMTTQLQQLREPSTLDEPVEEPTVADG
ncbi:MAG: DNA recombination protein RmuC [candidate division Zixibacteria bacterium]|nr:DNA recombination protein RmuC [candidate division Zixibacteria bacterium]MDH3937101.1 DNA recombination protein RmuC [candidate division Zixibacteria bacterium]MDH4033059.1 DNA recombination protein RmuC [candidate division Zixibacteria bacterium]